MRLLLTLCLLCALPALGESRRVAIVVGNNAGNGALPPLRYAENDAGKMARLLTELAEVQPQHLFLLQGRKAADVEEAVTRAKAVVDALHRTPDTRALLLFYFSGHSDGEALELGNERLPYARLRALLQGTGADVRVSVVDACNSGAALASKGGKPAPPFSIHLSDQLSARGEVFIASSAASESALESSEVMGSFFTHHLLSGLRGAADASGDKQVSLAEAYRYAYERTVAATAITGRGPQHPSYDYRLSGQGELILVSLQRPASVLEVPAGSDRVVVTDLARDQVVAEVQTGSPRELVLAPGRYGIRAVKGGKSYGARFTLEAGAPKRLSWAELSPSTEAIQVATKGAVPTPVLDAPRPAAPVRVALRDEPTARTGPVRLCILPFKNLLNEPQLEFLRTTLPEALATDFASEQELRLVERGEVDLAGLLKELDFEQGKYVDASLRTQLGKLAGAEVAVVGGYQRHGKTVRVNARFVQIDTGEVLHALKFERADSQLLQLQDELAKQARASIAVLQRRLRP